MPRKSNPVDALKKLREQRDELAAWAKLRLGVLDHPLNHHRFARYQLGDRSHPRLILVTQRKVQQQIAQMLNTQFCELGSQRGRQIRLLKGRLGSHAPSLATATTAGGRW